MDHEIAQFIEEQFVPFTVNLHEQAGLFGRFEALWTPTVLVMSPDGSERWRLEGFLGRDELMVWLQMGLGRVDFMAKASEDAWRWYDSVAREYPNSFFAPEATYWRAVCKYNLTHDPAHLVEVGHDLQDRYPNSIWAMKTLAWLPEDHPANRTSLR